MNKILIVSATELEAKALLKKCSKKSMLNLNFFESENFDLLISGVGMLKTAISLNMLLAERKYSFLINMGIAGAFSKNHSLTEVVNIESESIADFGLEKSGELIDVFEMNLEKPDEFPFSNKVLKNYSLINNRIVEALPKCSGLSVNLLTDSKEKIEIRKAKYGADVESMEGAAFFYSCLMQKIPFVSIKSISNYVGETDKNNWKINKAVENINNTIIQILNQIHE
jgi:futalosine hydrolase